MIESYLVNISNEYVPYESRLILHCHEMVVWVVYWKVWNIPTSSNNANLNFTGRLLININHRIQADCAVGHFCSPEYVRPDW